MNIARTTVFSSIIFSVLFVQSIFAGDVRTWTSLKGNKIEAELLSVRFTRDASLSPLGSGVCEERHFTWEGVKRRHIVCKTADEKYDDMVRPFSGRTFRHTNPTDSASTKGPSNRAERIVPLELEGAPPNSLLL